MFPCRLVQLSLVLERRHCSSNESPGSPAGQSLPLLYRYHAVSTPVLRDEAFLRQRSTRLASCRPQQRDRGKIGNYAGKRLGNINLQRQPGNEDVLVSEGYTHQEHGVGQLSIPRDNYALVCIRANPRIHPLLALWSVVVTQTRRELAHILPIMTSKRF